MNKKTKKEIIELLRSGNFTVVYWSRNDPTLYRGIWDYNSEFSKDEYAEMDKSIVKLPDMFQDGYCPEIVALLVEALAGKSDSI